MSWPGSGEVDRIEFMEDGTVVHTLTTWDSEGTINEAVWVDGVKVED